MFKQLLIYFLLFLSTQLCGQEIEQKLIPSAIGAGDFFGRYLCIENDDLLISAYQDDDNGYGSGALYIFQRETGSDKFYEWQKLTPEDGDVEEFFGYSLDISGNWAIVGAHHDSDFGGSSGSAFILKKINQQWSIDQKLLPDDPKPGDEFGKSVSIYKDIAISGAFLDDDKKNNSGSVYIFQREEDKWKQVTELYPADPEAHDQFGNFIDLFDNCFIVGVPEKKTYGDKSGCAYIFEKKDNVWNQTAKLTPVDGSIADQYGQAVSIDKQWAAVGAYKSDSDNPDGGAVYLYQKNGSNWKFSQKIVPLDNEEGDNYGNAVSLHNNLLAVGAYFDDDNGSRSGSVYLYKLQDDLWVLLSKLKPTDGNSGDAFGSSVSLNNKYLAAGAYADSDFGFFSGSAYVFKLDLLLNSSSIPKEKKSIHIFPTVTNNQFTLISDFCKDNPGRLMIYDGRGNLLFQSAIQSKSESFFIGQFPRGNYYISLRSPGSIFTTKIIKM